MSGYNETIPGKMLNLKFSRNLEGFISDFNIYSKFFDESQNIDWTTCQSFKEGDVFSWNQQSVANLTMIPSDNDANLMSNITEVDETELCPKKTKAQYKIEFFFSGPISNFDADLICNQMNGLFHLLPETREEITLLKNALAS